jgi:PhzF family phenazine biosynthesis protein
MQRACEEYAAVGATIFAIGESGPQKWIKVRAFASGQGVAEDPVCGSGDGSVAAYITVSGLFDGPDFHCISHQGSKMARPGYVSVHCLTGSDGLRVRIAGQAVITIQGDIYT